MEWDFVDTGDLGVGLTDDANNVIYRMVDTALKYRIPKMDDAKRLRLPIKSYESKPIEQIYTREVIGIVTDVVVFDFVNSDEKTYNFMNLVCIFFNTAIDHYCEKMGLVKSTEEHPGDVYFMYKGGNVLRLLYNEFKHSIPVSSIEIADGFFSKSFKKSDSDFSVFVNPGLSNFDRIYDDMVSLSYVLQYNIRNIFNREPKGNMFDVFAFTEYNSEKKDLILKNMLDDLNASGSITDPENEDFYGAHFHKVKMMGHVYELPGHGDDSEYKLDQYKADEFMLSDDADKRSDFAIDNCGPNAICVYSLNLPEEADYLYISANHSLDLRKGTEENETISKFTLVRTKLNATVYMEKDGEKKMKLLGGEVIDCTIIHKDTTGNNTTEEFEEYKHSISKYSLRMPDAKYTLKFFGYNRIGLIHDLERMLLYDLEKPWEDAKYAKRLNRLFFLYMVDLFANEINNEKRIDIIEKFRVGAIETLRKVLGAELESYDMIVDSVDVFDTQITINKFVKHLQRIARIAKGNAEDQDNFRQMLDTIDENTRYILEILNDVERHINSDATYEETYVKALVSDMAGGNPYATATTTANEDSILSALTETECIDLDKIFGRLGA